MCCTLSSARHYYEDSKWEDGFHIETWRNSNKFQTDIVSDLCKNVFPSFVKNICYCSDPLEPIISIKTENDDEQLVDETVFAEPM